MDNYTLHCIDQGGVCRNITLGGDETMFNIQNGLKQIQVGAIRNNMTSCSQGMLSCNNPLIINGLEVTSIFLM